MDRKEASTPGNFGITQQAIGETLPNQRVFHYEPLDPSVDCIRLLALYPCDKRRPETITCKLFHVRFSEKPRYEALSYTWGGSNPTETIMLDGELFAIQGNLYDALYDLRPTGNMPRMLWADAICIDQGNLEERKRQVGLMDYIYSRASTVLIWLGRGTAEVEKTFAEIVHFEDKWAPFRDKWVPFRNQRVRTKEEKYCDWVCKRSYWTRLWVIQEIGLSKNLRVCIGRSSRPWDDFLHCLNYHRRDGDFDYEYGLINNLDKKRKGRHGSGNRLEKLLEDFKYAGCKDPRDKIYGLLGGTILHLGPTYEEMISSSTLCKEWKLCFDAYYSSPLARRELREANEAYDSFLLKHSKWISHAVFCIHPQDMYSRATYMNGLWDGCDENWSTKPKII